MTLLAKPWRSLLRAGGLLVLLIVVACAEAPPAITEADGATYLAGLAALDGDLMWAGMSVGMRERAGGETGRQGIVRTAAELRGKGWTGTPHFVGRYRANGESWAFWVVHAQGPDAQDRHVGYLAKSIGGVLQRVEWIQ